MNIEPDTLHIILNDKWVIDVPVDTAKQRSGLIRLLLEPISAEYQQYLQGQPISISLPCIEEEYTSGKFAGQWIELGGTTPMTVIILNQALSLPQIPVLNECLIQPAVKRCLFNLGRFFEIPFLTKIALDCLSKEVGNPSEWRLIQSAYFDAPQSETSQVFQWWKQILRDSGTKLVFLTTDSALIKRQIGEGEGGEMISVTPIGDIVDVVEFKFKCPVGCYWMACRTPCEFAISGNGYRDIIGYWEEESPEEGTSPIVIPPGTYYTDWIDSLLQYGYSYVLTFDPDVEQFNRLESWPQISTGEKVFPIWYNGDLTKPFLPWGSGELFSLYD